MKPSENLLALQSYIDWFGGAHEENCSLDDTCECRGKPINDGINRLYNFLIDLDPLLEQKDISDKTASEIAAQYQPTIADVLAEKDKEIERLRVREREADDQLSWIAGWCQKLTGIENNKTIGRDGWPHRLVEVVAKAVGQRISELEQENARLKTALRDIETKIGEVQMLIDELVK